MIFSRQIQHSLRWLLAFFEGVEGSICRDFCILAAAPSDLTIITDASPWGIGGILCRHGWPISYFTDPITTHDLRRFRAKLGDSALTTLWESLALLVARRVWAHFLEEEPFMTVKADSLSALRIALKYSSSDPRINCVARELALDSSSLTHQVRVFTHIPGFTNFLADGLSRLTAPLASRKPFPLELTEVPRAPLPKRDSSFWKTWSSPQ